MGIALLRGLGVGAAVAAALVILSDVPILGSFMNFPGINWLLWIGAWAWLADLFVREARPALSLSENPSLPAMGGGALVGATSGLVGQLLQLVIQGFILTTAASHAAQTGSVAASAAAAGAWFSSFGSIIAIFLYPAFGAFWGGLFGLVWGGRVRQGSPVSTTMNTR